MPVIPTRPDYACDRFVTLAAERDQIPLNVLVSEAFVCLMVNLQPPERAVVQARLASVAVDLKAGRTLAGPRVARDVPLVEVFWWSPTHLLNLHTSSAALPSAVGIER